MKIKPNTAKIRNISTRDPSHGASGLNTRPMGPRRKALKKAYTWAEASAILMVSSRFRRAVLPLTRLVKSRRCRSGSNSKTIAVAFEYQKAFCFHLIFFGSNLVIMTRTKSKFYSNHPTN